MPAGIKEYELHRTNRRIAAYAVGAMSDERLDAEFEVMMRAPKGTKRQGLSRYDYLDILVDERERRANAPHLRQVLLNGTLYKCKKCGAYHVGGVDLLYAPQDGSDLLASCGGVDTDLTEVGVAHLEVGKEGKS